MKVFSTLRNESIVKQFQLIADGMVFTENDDDFNDCDAALLVARSKRAEVGVDNVHDYIVKAQELGVPIVLLSPATGPYTSHAKELVAFAVEHGVDQDSILMPEGKVISAGRVLDALRRIEASPDYRIVFDTPDGFRIDFDSAVSADIGHEREKEINAELARLSAENARLVSELDALRTRKSTVATALPGPFPCCVMGVKGGVGTSTVAAMLYERYIHVEAVGPGRPITGYLYHGGTPEDALRSGTYAVWDVSDRFPDLDANSAVLDISCSVPVEIVDKIVEASRCVVLVTDTSDMGFVATKNLVDRGFNPDILVVSKVVFGDHAFSAYSAPVYQGELGIERVVLMPGDSRAERAVLAAQRKATSPATDSEVFSATTGTLISMIREFTEGGRS